MWPRAALTHGALAFLLGVTLAASAASAQDPREIILRSAELDQRDADIRRNYTYLMRTEQRRLSARGRTAETKSETHEVLILYGATYRRLIARNDQPLKAEEEKKEQEKLDKEAERRRKTAERDPGRVRREDARAIEEQKALIREVAEAFAFKILREEAVAGHDAWVMQAEPLPGYRPQSKRAKMLPHFRGVLWITKEDYRWVKLEAEAIRTVSFGWILARLRPGTRLAMEQRPVEAGVWLPSKVSLQILAQVALLKKLEAEVDITFSNYRKFQSESRIVSTEELPPAPNSQP